MYLAAVLGYVKVSAGWLEMPKALPRRRLGMDRLLALVNRRRPALSL
jgi:hypothetical protein